TALTALHSFPTRRSSDLTYLRQGGCRSLARCGVGFGGESCQLIHPTSSRAFCLSAWRNFFGKSMPVGTPIGGRLECCGISISFRSEEHTSELQSLRHLVC